MPASYLIAVTVGAAMIIGALFWIVRGFYRHAGASRGSIDMSLDSGVRQLLDDFLSEFARRAKWDRESTGRLRAAGEEVLVTLAGRDGPEFAGLRRLRVVAAMEKGTAVLEFLASPQGTNLEEQLSVLEEHAREVREDELALRLLRHYASSVRHRHYHLNDLFTVRVEGSRG